MRRQLASASHPAIWFAIYKGQRGLLQIFVRSQEFELATRLPQLCGFLPGCHGGCGARVECRTASRLYAARFGTWGERVSCVRQWQVPAPRPRPGHPSLPLRGWGMVNRFLPVRPGGSPCLRPRGSGCWALRCCTMASSFFSRSCEREMNWGFRTSSASWSGQRKEPLTGRRGTGRPHVCVTRPRSRSERSPGRPKAPGCKPVPTCFPHHVGDGPRPVHDTGPGSLASPTPRAPLRPDGRVANSKVMSPLLPPPRPPTRF